MKPDAYMPMYWNEFWSAVEGRSELFIVAYLRALTYYYQHQHCRGLDDNEEFLRKLCRVERQDWPAIRNIMFDNDKYFNQDANGLWHQKRAEEEWQKATAKYNSQVKRSKAGAKARWKG